MPCSPSPAAGRSLERGIIAAVGSHFHKASGQHVYMA